MVQFDMAPPSAFSRNQRSSRWLLHATVLVVLTFTGSVAVMLGAPLHHPYKPCGPCWCNGTAVDCSNQRLTSVPSSASGLPPDATRLSLRNNSLWSLDPRVFSQFPSLCWLDLSHNVLTDLSNDAFTGLRCLEELNLSCNGLDLSADFSAGGPFDVISHSLVRLDLSNNYLAHVNPKVFRSSRFVLRWLSLSGNNITYGDASEWPLRYLTNLTFLNISHNNLRYVRREMFKIGIQVLDISHNRIPLNEESYPDDAFENLGQSLVYLKMKGNCKNVNYSDLLGYPDKALSKLQQLQTLWIDGLYKQGFGAGFQNLTSLKRLNLSGRWNGSCYIDTLSNETFENISSSLRILDLSLCAIRHIEADAFAPLRDFLDILDLSHNVDLGFDTLGEAFYGLQGSRLTKLYVDSIVRPYITCNTITKHNTQYFRNTSLKRISARNNRLEVFCPGALTNMPPTLTHVDLYGNNLEFGAYVKDLKSLTGLKTLDMDGQIFAKHPPDRYPPVNLGRCTAFGHDQSQCRLSWSPYDTHYRYAFIEEQRIPTYERGLDEQYDGVTEEKLIYELPPNLRMFRSRWNELKIRLKDIHVHPNNSLVFIDISNNLLTSWIGPITGLDKLETLNLDDNLAFDFDDKFYATFTSMKNLTLSRNHLRESIMADENGKLFGSLRKVEILDMSKNYLNTLPRQLFRGLVSLRTLNLSHNEITDFSVDITHIENLTTIDLSYNMIGYLTQEVMDHLDRIAMNMEVHLDLTFNPLSCTCQHLTFLTWILQSEVVLSNRQPNYCYMDGNTRHVTDFFGMIKDLQSSCINTVGMLIGAVVCAFCLLVVLVGALIYRFRWKLRYLYYASRLAYRRHEAISGEDRFEFDAFVSYSSENNDFVLGELLDELETRAGLRLNVHARDFIPGMPIPTNIVGAVHSSRRTLVVLTRALLESDWCHYEMQMATMEASYTGRDVLVFLLYEDVPSHQLPREMLYNLQASTYISYPGATADSSIIRDFWNRLAQAIRQ